MSKDSLNLCVEDVFHFKEVLLDEENFATHSKEKLEEPLKEIELKMAFKEKEERKAI